MPWVRSRERHRKEEQDRLTSSLLLAIGALSALVVIGTVAMHHLEGWSWVSSFYFSVTTLATVGYGDLHPTHDLARLFIAFYVISGVTVALSAMTVVGRNYLEYLERRMMRDRWRMRRAKRDPGEHAGLFQKEESDRPV